MNRQRRAESVKPWRNADPAGKAFPPPNNDEHPAAGAGFAQIAVLPVDDSARGLHFLPLPTLPILLTALRRSGVAGEGLLKSVREFPRVRRRPRAGIHPTLTHQL